MEAAATVPSVSSQQGHEVLILQPAQEQIEPRNPRRREEAQGEAIFKRRYTRKVEYN